MQQTADNGQCVYVVDDDISITRLIAINLTASGYQPKVFHDGYEALDNLEDDCPDLVLLDLVMPNCNGLEITRLIRLISSVPIIVLSVRNEITTKLTALDLGADDYVTKPFSLRELQARVSAMLRRVEMDRTAPVNGAPDPLEFGPLVINTAAHETTLDGEVVRLRRREFDLLAFLARNEGQAFSREQLLQHVWGYDYVGDTRTVDVHVRWLRQKIEKDPSDPRRILTVRGVAYRFAG